MPVFMLRCSQKFFAEPRLGFDSSQLEDSLEVLHRLVHGPFHGALDQQSIVETRNAPSGFVFYDETIFAAVWSSLEVTFMANRGQSLLTADVYDPCVLLELFPFHV